MSSTKPPTIISLLLLLLLLTSSSPAKAISFQQCRTLISLSHSLLTRVSQLRTARGDLQGGVGLLGSTWAVRWDYLRNYAWRNISSAELFRVVSDLNQILNELTRLKSADELATWVWRKYHKDFTDIPFQECRILISLSHSLVNRVAQLRTSRGDLEGSQRARIIAAKLEGVLSLWESTRAIGWDFLRNYAWRDMSYAELFRAVSDLIQILNSLNESTRLKSPDERATSSPLRDLVLAVQTELVEGYLLRDCLELGSNDLEGLRLVVIDIAGQFRGGTNGRNGDL